MALVARPEDVICEFLEAAFHTILFTRNIYPVEIFERQRKFGIPVRMSRHPELSTYILDAVKGARAWLGEGSLQKAVLAVLGPEGHESSQSPPVLERFIFDIKLINSDHLSQGHVFSLQQKLSAFLLKLQVCDSTLPPLPTGCHFTVLLYTNSKDENLGDDKHDFFEITHHDLVEFPSSPRYFPVKKLETDYFNVDVRIEHAENSM